MHLWPWKKTTPTEYAMICRLIIFGSCGAAVVAEDQGARVLWLMIGLGTMALRFIYVRFTE